jgi:hypothetical protein
VPPPPVEVSEVSTSTPEGCTLTVEQTETGPISHAFCPDPVTGEMSEKPVSVFDTSDVILGIPTDDPNNTDCTFEGQDYDLERFKHMIDKAYGRVGEHSGCWYYWNGSWYYYNY